MSMEGTEGLPNLSGRKEQSLKERVLMKTWARKGLKVREEE